MLLEKLERASKDARRARIRLTLIVMSCTALVALFLLGVVTIDLSRLGLGSQAKQTATSAGSPTEPPQESVSRSSDAVGVKLPNTPLASEIEEVKPQVTRETTGAEAQAKTAAREAFKRELAAFDAELEPEISREAFERWNGEGRRVILETRDRAVSQFTTGDYEAALSSLVEAGRIARQELLKRDTAFDSAFAQARSAYERDDYQTASLGIAEALRLKPWSQDAQNLQQAIERLPPLLALIEQAAIARTENNLEAEQSHLRQALEADPSRSGLTERLETVEREIRERAFSKHIETGMNAISRRDLSAAYDSLKNARAVFKDRPEASLLSKQAAGLARELKFEDFISKARTASSSDDWRSAGGLYRQAADLYPDNQEASTGYALATNIVSLDEKLSAHLGTPQRLASSNVAALVRDLVRQTDPLAAHSPSLRDKAHELSVLLEAYAVKIQVRVLSDGETNISVRGVGRVGKTEDKTIALRPGQHTFEGIRPGYRAKLIEVQIPPGSEGFTVEIVCDERI
ncbi:hypothetical protein [Denitrobaculum tricleocarpae]|uniref:Tetratricopeptide repeat protein n=1 Tax=Denitrobaculum tricleocarpae TaxID=2591009 RepID=A0A545TL89_9PROT|nr:hypothetical protein [Denitrobaculum tricleocarpae]TQV77956.1 hypothetical protein FKG95_20705 [Denitrobaculum tricleocarpae]